MVQALATSVMRRPSLQYCTWGIILTFILIVIHVCFQFDARLSHPSLSENILIVAVRNQFSVIVDWICLFVCLLLNLFVSWLTMGQSEIRNGHHPSSIYNYNPGLPQGKNKWGLNELWVFQKCIAIKVYLLAAEIQLNWVWLPFYCHFISFCA